MVAVANLQHRYNIRIIIVYSLNPVYRVYLIFAVFIYDLMINTCHYGLRKRIYRNRVSFLIAPRYLNHATARTVMRNSRVVWTHASGIRGPHIDAWTADPEVSSPSCWRVVFMLHVTHDQTFIRETNIVCAWPGRQVSYTTTYIHPTNFIPYNVRSMYLHRTFIYNNSLIQHLEKN